MVSLDMMYLHHLVVREVTLWSRGPLLLNQVNSSANVIMLTHLSSSIIYLYFSRK